MDDPELFLMSTSESEGGEEEDRSDEAVADLLPNPNAPEEIYALHPSATPLSVDEVIFGGKNCHAVPSQTQVFESEKGSPFSHSCSNGGSEGMTGRGSTGIETSSVNLCTDNSDAEKKKLELQEHPISDVALRSMTCAEVRAVLEPFFQRKEAARALFEQVRAQLVGGVTATGGKTSKNMVERWRRLVNISNWGDGTPSRDDVLLPEALVPPSQILLGVPAAAETRKTTAPFETRHLRPHQLDGIRFLWSILVEGPIGRVPAVGCILAHTMGLGKTCQVVVFLHLFINEQRRLQKGPQKVLVVVPKSTRPSWFRELGTWSQYFPLAQRITASVIDESSDRTQRVEMYKRWREEGGVLLVGYEMLLGLTKLMETKPTKRGIDLLICDEAHRLKSTHVQISAALRGLNPLRRLLLTGTPLQNHLQEYWAMVDFAVHKYFERQRFQEFFINPIETSIHKKANSMEVTAARMKTFILIRELSHFVQRVDSTPLLNELPPLHEYVLVVPLSPLQSNLYNRFLQLLRLRHSKINFLQAVTYANKISAHPQLLFGTDPASPLGGDRSSSSSDYDDDDDDDNDGRVRRRKSGVRPPAALFGRGSDEEYADLHQPPANYTPAPEDGTKLYIAMKIIKGAVLRGERTLFFSLSTKLLDLFEDIIATMNCRWQKDESLSRPIRFCRLDGNSSGVARESALRSFDSANGPDVLLLSMRAGGVGLTITSATRVILADSGFNPADDRQAIGRVYRYGQTRPVFVYRLVCSKTLEHRVFEQKVAKEWLFRTVVEEASLKRDTLAGLRLQSMFELLGRSWAVSSEAPVLTEAQKTSTARLVAEDGVLAGVADDILYAEAHEVYLQHDELVQYGKEERKCYEEYQKQCVFKVGGYPDRSGDDGVSRHGHQQAKEGQNAAQRSRTLTALVDDIIRNRAEENPQLLHLLRMMGVTVSVAGRPERQTTRDDDGACSPCRKMARMETQPHSQPVVIDELEEDSVLFGEGNRGETGLVINPSKYEPYRPGRDSQNAILIDEDEE